jgi:hypothetical protein
MKPILRSILAVSLGFLAGSCLIFVFEQLGMLVFPPPAGMDPSNMESVKAAMAKMPIGAFLSVLLAWCLGTFAAAWVAARVAGRSALVHGRVIGFLFLAAGVLNMLMIPHPVWFWVLGVAVFLPSAYLGAKVAENKQKPASAPDAWDAA